MEDFWSIVRSWNHPLGQAIFLLIIIGGFCTLIKWIIYYVIVGMRGWPPPGTAHPIEDDDGDDDEP